MDQQRPPQSEDVNATVAKSFTKMSGKEKLRHVGKICIFLLTFGFAFPNIFSD